MLIAPMSGAKQRPRAVASARTRAITNITEEEEANAFMSFLGEHSQFAASHKGA